MSDNYKKTLDKLLFRAATWHIVPGLVEEEPFSAKEFLEIVDAINTIYALMHTGIGETSYAHDVAILNIKADIVRCVDMDKFWDIAG